MIQNLSCVMCLISTEINLKKLEMTGYKKLACEKIHFYVILFLFCSVISNCIQLLVQDLENACDAPLTALIKVQYFTLNSPYLFMADLILYIIRGRVQDLIIPGKMS